MTGFDVLFKLIRTGTQWDYVAGRLSGWCGYLFPPLPRALGGAGPLLHPERLQTL